MSPSQEMKRPLDKGCICHGGTFSSSSQDSSLERVEDERKKKVEDKGKEEVEESDDDDGDQMRKTSEEGWRKKEV